MKDAVRQKLLERLEDISELAPEMRLGQLVANLAYLAKGPWDQTLWDLDDGEMFEAADQFLHDLRQREKSSTPVIIN